MGGNSVFRPNGYYRNLQKLEKIAREELKKQLQKRPRRRVFLSFKVEDKNLVDLLRGQAKNENSDLDFIDFSLRVPFNSKNAEYIKKGIRERIKSSSLSIILIGENTYKSEWVDWEIRETIRLGKKVFGVKLKDDPNITIPSSLIKNKIEILPWNHEKINGAIKKLSSK